MSEIEINSLQTTKSTYFVCCRKSKVFSTCIPHIRIIHVRRDGENQSSSKRSNAIAMSFEVTFLHLNLEHIIGPLSKQ